MIIKEITFIVDKSKEYNEQDKVWKITGENDTVQYITHEELWYSLSVKDRQEIVYKNLDNTSINWREYFVGRDINIIKLF